MAGNEGVKEEGMQVPGRGNSRGEGSGGECALFLRSFNVVRVIEDEVSSVSKDQVIQDLVNMAEALAISVTEK